MNLSTPIPTFLCCLILSLLIRPHGRASVIIVDSFEQGGFNVSYPDLNSVEETVNLPLGTYRYTSPKTVGIGSSYRAMVRTLDPVAGTLAFLVDATSTVPAFPPGLDLVYRSEVLQDISSYSEFILGFSDLTGVGTLYVELGGSNGLEGVFRVDLTGPGEVRYPVSAVYANVGHSLDGFASIKFTFESRSELFYFTLDEIRLVPEPSAALLGLVAAAGVSVRRRRS